MLALRPSAALVVTVLATAACHHDRPAAAPPVNAGGEPVAPEPGGRVAARPCTAETAAGDWVTETGSDFEEISLEADGSFHSHLHARPFTSGRWTVADGAVVLEGDDGSTVRIDGARCATQLFGAEGDQAVRWNRLEASPPAE